MTGRRRSPGLRREDVAALAGLSATWYTWLEQGRDVRPSNRVLENLSRTLRLSEEERDYLFSLARNQSAPHLPSEDRKVSPAVLRALEALAVPAYVMNLRWDLMGWNQLALQLIRDYRKIPVEQRNMARILLLQDNPNLPPDETEAMARRVVGKLRVDYSQAGKDETFDKLIEELRTGSRRFAELWARASDLITRSEAVHPHHHAKHGMLMFEHTSYVVEGASGLRIILFVPHDAKTKGVIAKLNRANNPA